MVDVAEHVYDDDPALGHPDVRTRLDGAAYFFLGNGAIQAAVQCVTGPLGTPLGLLVMHPERFGKKRDALTMDARHGLGPTVVRLEAGGRTLAPAADALSVVWRSDARVPTVEATWGGAGLAVCERFYCPSASLPRLAREIVLANHEPDARTVTLSTGAPDAPIEHACALEPHGRARLWLVYDLSPQESAVTVRFSAREPLDEQACAVWSRRIQLASGDATIDELLLAATRQLPAVVSSEGRVDGSIWQYNREWVRDQAVIAQALALQGRTALAGRMLRRLLAVFVTADGATLDSSEVRGRDDVELDQNGILLHVLREYVEWTDDRAILNEYWPTIAALADYPLRPEFRHAPSGLLSGSREYWERHTAHGIEPGLEMIYQVAVALGLESAAALARLHGSARDATRWLEAASALRHAVLRDPVYGMHDHRGFIKRRRLDGSVQETMNPQSDAGLPPGVPLASPGEHRLNPDTCSVLPIAWGFVDPCSPLAAATLDSVEALWNQQWDDGGYGRYHVSSEPDSPGAWPFASIFVARANAEAGRSDAVWRVLRWLASTRGSLAGSWFEFHGPRVSPPFPQVGVIPWTWAELTIFFVRHLLGVRPTADGIYVRPRLPAGLPRVEARIPIRTGWFYLDLTADPAADDDAAFTIPWTDGEARLAVRVRPLA
jgi:hypothetical protein